MKVLPINNANFRGLFTDKSAQNNGEWLMEYRPYSWEIGIKSGYLSDRMSTMSKKIDIDLSATSLPDNEQIYTETPARHSSKDIFGTESYYKDYRTNLIRRHITERPAMTRTESLMVYFDKMNKFIEMKKEKRAELESKFDEFKKNSDSYYETLKESLDDLCKGFLDRKKGKGENQTIIDSANVRHWLNFTSYDNYIKEYIKYRDSLDTAIESQIPRAKEIMELQNAQLKGQLVDISRRDVNDPNKPLWNALQNVKTALEKLVALPHKSISMKELIKQAGADIKQSGFDQKVIAFVDKMIYDHTFNRYIR